MKRMAIGTIVGGLLLFAWQSGAWMFLGIHSMDPEPYLGERESAVVSALEGTKRGVYWIPGLSEADMAAQGEAYETWEKQHEAGPRIWINYDPEGGPVMPPKQMAAGAVTTLLTVFVVAFMLRSARVASALGRFGLCVGFGVFLALAVDVPGWLWMNHPVGWTRGWIIDHVGGMAIVGVVLGLVMKPE